MKDKLQAIVGFCVLILIMLAIVFVGKLVTNEPSYLPDDAVEYCGNGYTFC